jgi:ABC-type Na+ efflux pump permease subunit
MRVDTGRTAAVVRKEFRDYRRSRSVIGTAAVLPLVFLVEPLLIIFRLGPSVSAGTVQKSVGGALLLMLITPALVPAVIAAYSVVGEREQGTLEPLLTTPVRREELLLGKALAATVPAVAVAYLIFGAIEVSAHLFARNPGVAPALWQGSHVLAEILFAPLLAGWSTWVCTGISVRASDVRVAQQLGTLASLPPLGVVALASFDVFAPSLRLALVFALILLTADVLLWRVVSAMFDRERLITGIRAPRTHEERPGAEP